MKKNYLKILCLVSSFFLICGCTEQHNSKFEKIIAENDYGDGWLWSNPKGILCEEIKNIKSIHSNYDYFVTDDGSLYKFNIYQIFSNDKNCMKVDYGNNNIAYIFDNGFYDKNNKLIYFLKNEEVVSVNDYKATYSLHDFLNEFNLTDDFDFISYGGGTYIFIKDNMVFWYDNYRDIENRKKKTFEIPANEVVLGLYNDVIKTDKNYYTISATNKEECKKYTDIKCEVNFSKSNLGEVYDDIIFLTGGMLIDKNWHVYGHNGEESYSLVE